MKDKLDDEKGLGSCDADWTHRDLLKALADCWSWVALDSKGARLEYFGASGPEGYQRVIQGSYHDFTNDHADAKLIVHLLDEMGTGGFYINVCSPRGWLDHNGEYCVILVAPLGSGAHPQEWMGVHGSNALFGPTRAWAVASAFVAICQLRTSQPTDTPQGLSHSQIPSPKFEEQDVKL